MNIAVHTPDRTNFPNLALMKISAWHKAQGNNVEWFNPLLSNSYDQIYSSKVFTFSHCDPYLPDDERVEKGGTGYQSTRVLPNEIEHRAPDYSLYNVSAAYGFTTRGCPNKCSRCIVPQKEGNIRANADIEEFWDGQKDLILMDNNILAHSHGIKQLEKISKLNIRLDCNQGMEAKLVGKAEAKLLGNIKWSRIRFACDRQTQMKHVARAVSLIRHYSGKKGKYFVYVLVGDRNLPANDPDGIQDALARVEFLRKLDVDPFAQPFRDYKENLEPTEIQRQFARWVNRKQLFKSCSWEEYNQHQKKAPASATGKLKSLLEVA
ncbi:hypothetical protein [Halodesulfovibrio sp.]|jgi:hypothetical protein|uniref:hypothetical protein n=1 Tax=Halodesulfovibrio sp. TaxID=1912772 RepID=UPI0025E762F4|nr:hypothetical protein [Halodesulfovibrio sp.]MCT4625844.1 hypothetical protein [Halodesulfovibrio sp.]